MGGGACVRSGCLSPLCGAAVGQRAPLCRSPQLAAGSELWPSLSGPIVLPGLCPVGLQGCGSFLVLPVPGAGGRGARAAPSLPGSLKRASTMLY